MPKGKLLVVIALAAAATGCASNAVETPAQAAPDETRSRVATTASTTPPSTTSTTLGYESLGEEVGVSDSVLGPVTWQRASSIPAQLLMAGDLPGPTHAWEYDWLARYENAQEVTGACFEIYEEAAGYLGLGPCPVEWAPWTRADDPAWERARIWGFPGASYPGSTEWIWMRNVWFSPDGESWDNTTKAFADSTAVVAAEPWSVAEKDGRWVVIGATGIDDEADPGRIPWDERTYGEKYYGENWLIVPKGSQPAAWVSDDLTEWQPISAEFADEGMDTRLTSVVAGDRGWFIFGIRGSQEPPRIAEWVAWASIDGIDWEELPMAGVYDTPCEPTRYEHCGMIKAHMIGDSVVAYAWTWPLGPHLFGPDLRWRLLVGTF